jgi:hypothetical protein
MDGTTHLLQAAYVIKLMYPEPSETMARPLLENNDPDLHIQKLHL